MSDTNSYFGVSEWKDGLFRIPTALPERNNEVQRYFDRLWPAADHYVSSLNPVFLLDLPKLSEKQEPELWMIRDGLIPAIWFFTKNPEPPKTQSRYLFHASLEAYVPPAWRDRSGLWDFTSEGFQEPISTRPEELLLLGHIMPSVCSLERLESDCALVLKKVGGSAGLKKLKISAFLPARYEDHEVHGGPAFYNRFMITLCKLLGTNIDAIEFAEFNERASFRKAWVHEFNEGLLYVDSMQKRVALQKGARLIEAPKKQKFQTIYPFFPSLGCGVDFSFKMPFRDYLSNPKILRDQEAARKLHAAMASSPNLSFPWERWFTSWCATFVS